MCKPLILGIYILEGKVKIIASGIIFFIEMLALIALIIASHIHF
ncbi:putative membrane protein [Janthinobacterium agaricidamnosum NBRC 102515 = DSM 9628]|uniref:Putative membrane protein n=1 Tax=Janthinobacterium agaricidamnosum NBRC 102515 = DSM 9628 TaxID=1349767 RepID=W0V4A0_9BURK|nr:putative membrane protein [Janthinobacterium agaricidamnosum NBRC 102515 = DSM 9628]